MEIVPERHATAYRGAVGEHNVEIGDVHKETLWAKFGLGINQYA